MCRGSDRKNEGEWVLRKRNVRIKGELFVGSSEGSLKNQLTKGRIIRRHTNLFNVGTEYSQEGSQNNYPPLKVDQLIQHPGKIGYEREEREEFCGGDY